MNDKTVVAVAPYIDQGDLVIDISVNEDPLAPARVPIIDLVSDYITYHQEMFSPSIADSNKNDALALAGLLRLCAKRIEEATY